MLKILKLIFNKIKCKIACCYKSSCSLNDDTIDNANNVIVKISNV
jgi:hypothetical protein